MIGDGVAGCVMWDMSRLRVFGADGARYAMLGSRFAMVRDGSFAEAAVKLCAKLLYSHAPLTLLVYSMCSNVVWASTMCIAVMLTGFDFLVGEAADFCLFMIFRVGGVFGWS